MKLAIDPDTNETNLIIAPGGGGGGYSDYGDWTGFDWGGGGSGGDWGSTGSSWNEAYYEPVYSAPDVDFSNIQQVVIVGERMTLWEKMDYDLEVSMNAIGGAIDSAIATFNERGYVQFGDAQGLGIVVTIDASHDIYVGITSGTGAIIAAGLTPEGMSQSDFLSGWSAGGTLPGTGAGVVASNGTIGPIVGLPGQGVAYSINASAATLQMANELSSQASAVVNQAADYFNRANGYPTGGGGGGSGTNY